MAVGNGVGHLGEQALAESEERYRKLVELLPDAVIVHREGRLAYANAAAARLLGARSPQDLVRRPILDVVHPDFHEVVRQRVHREIDQGLDAPLIEERFVRLDGTEVDVEVAGAAITYEGRPAALVVVRDITERKRAEEAVRRSERRFRTLLESAPDPAVIVDADGRIVLVNEQTERVFGFARSELIGQPLELLLPERIRGAHVSHLAGYFDRPSPRPMGVGRELAGQRRDGTQFPVEISLAFLDTDGGGLAMAFVRDTTDRVKADLAASEAEARYRVLVEQVPAVTYVWDFREGLDRARVPYVSPQMEQVLGFPPEAFMAEANFWFERTHPEDRDAVVAETARSVAAGEPFKMEYRMIARDGRVVWVRDQATALLQADSGTVLVHQGILVDITEAVHMAEELRARWEELRRMDADRRRLLARLVAAQEEERRRIATSIHDDPVQKITAAATRLDLLGADHPELAEDAKYQRARQTVRDSIASLRHLIFEVRPHSLDRDGDLELALRTMAEVEASADPSTTYEVRWNARSALPPEVATVLYRIAQEAVVNARKHAKASSVVVSVTDQGEGISLRVLDDGCGFSTETGSKSAPGHLGLTTMRERAELAGGTIGVRSSPGMGTCVEVRLPL
jgi:PAS domain S-box-containing protein